MAIEEACYQITEESELREMERLWELARHNEASALFHAREEGFKEGFESFFKEKFGDNFKEKFGDIFKEQLEKSLEQMGKKWRSITINRDDELVRMRAELKRRWEQKRQMTP